MKIIPQNSEIDFDIKHNKPSKLTRLISVVGAIIGVLIFVISFNNCKITEGNGQVLDNVNMRFDVAHMDSTRIVYFGDKDSVNLSNHFEIHKNSDLQTRLFWIIIDNTSGKMKIKKLIFEGMYYYGFNIPQYDCVFSVNTNEPDSIHMPSWKFSEDLRIIDRLDDTSDQAEMHKTNIPHNYILAEICLAPYGEYVFDKLYDMGHIKDMDSRLNAMTASPGIKMFSELKDMGVSVNYSDNNRKPYKRRAERVLVVTPENKRTYISEKSWLFLDTMDIDKERRIKQVVWMYDTHNLMVFYKFNAEDSLIPVNAAYYRNNLTPSSMYFK